jgi:hypothetical protein
VEAIQSSNKTEGLEWVRRSIPVWRRGTGRLDELESTGASIQVILFGVGGLIHVAVGLAGGIGAFLTNRSGFSRNA